MTNATTTLTNDFHGTEYATRKTRDELNKIVDMIEQDRATASEKALIRKIRNSLCGIEGCRCGTNAFDER